MMRWLGTIAQDVKFAARVLAKDPRFTLSAIVALALAIGVNTAVFRLVNMTDIRDLPFERADRLVGIRSETPRGREGMSYADYRDLVETSRTVFEGMAASTDATMAIAEEGRAPERYRGTYISANAFRLLRSAPVLGRDFLPEDDRPGAAPVLILEHAVWQGRYGGDRSIVGRTVRVNGVPATVIGVMPSMFRYPMLTQAWQPLALAPGLASAKRNARNIGVLARLNDSADLARAQTEVAAVAARLAAEDPDTNKEVRASVRRLKDLHPTMPRPLMFVFGGAVGFVLLIACANLASLLLSRAAGRSREIAIRASLGATRRRIVGQLLTECLMIAVLAALAALPLSLYAVRAVAVAANAIEPGVPVEANTPFWVDVSMDGLSYAVLGVLCAFATLAFGLVPSLMASRTDVNDVLKAGGRGAGGNVRARRLTGAFVVGQIALTLVLLTGAGLLWRGFLTQYRATPGFDSSNMTVMRVTLPAEKYGTADARQRFFAQLDERLNATPGVSAASVASGVPLESFGASRDLMVDGLPAGESVPKVIYLYATRRYFDTLKLPIVRGRALVDADGHPQTAGAIVDQRFVEKYLSNADPIGRRFRFVTPDAAAPPAPWFTIVGVSATVAQLIGPQELVKPVVYALLSAEPAPARSMSMLVRRAADSASIVSAVREDVRRLDPDLPIYGIETMDDALARGRYPVTLMSRWFTTIALIALVMASVGLYALTAHSVAQRTQEIGVRMALGADAAEVLRLFMRRTLIQLAIGLPLGLAGALSVGKLLQAYLHGTSARDPATLAIVTAILILVSVVAAIVPARRATHVDPMVALRYE